MYVGIHAYAYVCVCVYAAANTDILNAHTHARACTPTHTCLTQVDDLPTERSIEGKAEKGKKEKTEKKDKVDKTEMKESNAPRCVWTGAWSGGRTDGPRYARTVVQS